MMLLLLLLSQVNGKDVSVLLLKTEAFTTDKGASQDKNSFYNNVEAVINQNFKNVPQAESR